MPKLFRGAFWLGVGSFITGIAERINQNPRIVRIVVLVLLNLGGFFCFWIVFYGLGLLLVPPPEHQDYKLMRFGVQFVSFVISLLLSIGLYNLIRGVVLAGKFVSDKISNVGKGFKDGGTVVVKIPKKAVDATRQVVEGTAKLVKKTGSGIGEGIKNGAEIVKEKAPLIGEAISTTAQKTGMVLKESAKWTADWSKENIPKVVDGAKGFVAGTYRKISALFKKNDGNA